MELIEIVLKSDGKVLNELTSETLVEIFNQLDYSNNTHKPYILDILKILFKRRHIELITNKNINLSKTS